MSQKALFTKRPLRRRVRKGVSHDTTRRSLEWLKKNGYHAATVERMRFHPSGANVEGRPTFFILGRTDLLGFADVLAYRDDSEVLAVQACRRDEIQSHLRRYRADDETLAAYFCRVIGYTGGTRKGLIFTPELRGDEAAQPDRVLDLWRSLQ